MTDKSGLILSACSHSPLQHVQNGSKERATVLGALAAAGDISCGRDRSSERRGQS